MKSKVKSICYKLLISSLVFFGILVGQPSNAALPDLATFKCPMSPAEGNKLALFVLSNSADDFVPVPLPEGEDGRVIVSAVPTDGEVFCVEVPQSSENATWGQLLSGANYTRTNLLQSLWSDDDVIRQFFTVSLAGYSVWKDQTAGSLDDPDPGKEVYQLQKNGTAIPEGIGRIRYKFNDLSPSSPNQYLYFIKIVDSTQYGGSTTECAKHNGDLDKCEKDTVNKCVFAGGNSQCYARNDARICDKLIEPECNTIACHWKESKCQAKTSATLNEEAVDKWIAARYTKPDGYDGPLPDCAFTGTCRSVEDLLGLGVEVADWVFKIIAGLGFAFFVYGGVTMIFSFGNAEKVGQGKQIIVAATIGIIIAFSAYVLVSFVVKAIGINSGLTPFN